MNTTDEAVHGFYIGYKFRRVFADLTLEEQNDIRDYAIDLLMQLYDNEIAYTEMMYAEVGKVEEVTAFIHYNANKALQNLGFDPIFPDEICQVNPAIMEALKTDSAVTHDFFSVNGSSYFMPRYETVEDDDYAMSDSDPRVTLYHRR